jgi:enoyl-CoA hydratase/carnithine racemase
VIGSIRGRSFILTQQQLDATTAKAWDVVHEIVLADRLLARAHEIARGIAALPPLTSRTHQRLRRIIDEGIGFGLALEGISAADVAHTAAKG